ncbi:MAG: metallophosphoesterase [Spirochaetaceae bacterium]
MDEINDNNFRIVHISDTQLGFTDSMNRNRLAKELGRPEEDLELQYSKIDKEYYELAVKEINQLDPKPDVVINTGDLVDSPENVTAWQDYQDVTNSISSPVYEVKGNHDGPIERGKDYYSFTLKGLLFTVINTQFLKNSEFYPEECNKQKRFIEKELSDNRYNKNIIMLMHHPPIPHETVRNEDYFFIPAIQRKWVIELLEKYNIRAVLSGHLHRNIILKYKDTELITTGSIGEALGHDYDGEIAKRGFRVIDINLKTSVINHDYIKLH